MTINEYFPLVLCINLTHRTDRWAHVEEQCRKHSLSVQRFDGHLLAESPKLGNHGCTASHRGVLEVIAHLRPIRALVLEDDFDVVVDNLQESFSTMINEVPEDWNLLYLGGSYAKDPKRRISKHVIQNDGMRTTSSYGITWQTAKQMAPHIYGIGPIDCLFDDFNQQLNSYTFDPRLMAQWTNHSDIQGRVCNNAQSMLDVLHVERLDGKSK